MATNPKGYAMNRFPAGPVVAMRKQITSLLDEALEESLRHISRLRASWPSAQSAARQSQRSAEYEAFRDRVQDVLGAMGDAFDDVFDDERITKFVAKLQQVTMVLALKGLRTMLNKAKRSLGDRIPPFRTTDWNRIHEGRVLANVQVVKGLGDWAKAQLARIITDGASRGTPYSEVISQILETADMARTRAEAIAINELNTTYNMITNDRYQALGIGRAIWVTAKDERVCSICQPLNGRVFTVSELAGEGIPPKHVRCRCTTVAHPEDVRALRG